MPTLTIDNSTQITNTVGTTLRIAPFSGIGLSVVTVTGPVGPQGPVGPIGTGAGAAGVVSLNGLTGNLGLVGNSGVLIALSGTNFVVSAPLADYVPISRQINSIPLTGNLTVRAADIPVDYVPGAGYSNLQQFINTMNSPGLIRGGIISDAGSGLANISVGTGMLRVADDDISSLAFVNIPAASIQVPMDLTQYYIGFVYNTGSPMFELRSANDWDNDTEIALGTVVNFFNTLVITNNPFKVGDPITNIIQRFDAMAPVSRDEVVGGLILGEAGTRNITLSAGKLWTRLNDYVVPPVNTAIAGSIYSAYYNGVSWTYTPGLTQWDNLYYNDITMGLRPLDIGYFANLWFYLTIENNSLGWVYGQNQQGNLTDASTESPPSFLPPNFLNGSILVGRMIFHSGALVADGIDSAFSSVFSPSPVTAHNSLSDLQGGTISQYYHLTSAAYNSANRLAANLTIDTALEFTGASGAALDIGGGGRLGPAAFLVPVTGVAELNGLSGQLNIGGAQGIAISTSGQIIYVSGQNWALNSDLTSSGQTLNSRINTLSGYVNSVSGGLQAQITDGGGTQVRVTGSTTLPTINLTGVGGVALWISGQTAYVSGEVTQVELDVLSGYTDATFTSKATTDLVSGNLTQSGIQLMARDLAISGAIDTKLTVTGSQLYNLITGQSGQSNINFSTVTTTNLISGNLIQSGIALIARDTAISGALDAKIVATGTVAIIHANSIGSIISGNLTQTGIQIGLVSGAISTNLTNTGVALYALASGVSGNLGLSGQSLFARDSAISGALDTKIANSGQQSWETADANGRNISGNLAATGAILDGKITSLSGFTIGASGALQALIAGANGTQVKVSGSSTLLVADFSGIGSTIVYVSGGQVFISGNTASVGVTQGQLDALSGYSNASFSTTGSLALVSGNLTQTGVQLINRIDGISGGLEVRIIATGNSAVSQANSIGSTVSGNLTQSGVQLQTLLTNTGSALYQMFTGVSGLANGASVALSGALTQTGVQLINRDASISGGLEVRIIASGNVAIAHANSIGQTISGNLTSTGLAIGLVSGGLEARIIATGQSALAHANSIGVALSGNATQTGLQLQTIITNTGATLHGMIVGSSGLASSNAVTISGNLTTTGLAIGLISGALATKLADTGAALSARDASISGGLEARITATGQSMLAHANSIGQTLSGNLTQTGVALGLVSGALSVRLTDTGSALFARDLAISGALQALIAGGGSIVRISGSSPLATADFTGIGGVSVVYSGGQVFISGAAGAPGGGVPSVNSITSAVTIVGTGGFMVSTAGATITVSGLPFAVDKTILFNNQEILSGDLNFAWDVTGSTLKIGQPQLFYSGNPLSIGGSGDVLQANIRNRSTRSDASSDWIATSNIGSDASGYIDMGINGSNYNLSEYDMGSSGDGYLYVNGGALDIATTVAQKGIQFFTAGTRSFNLRATVTDSGIYLPQSGIFQIGSGVTIDNNSLTISSGQLTFSGIANNPIAAMFASGQGNTLYGPAMYSRRMKIIQPNTTTSQILYGDTAANVGTLSTLNTETLGEVTLYTPAAGLSAGTSFTLANAYRGTGPGVGNGFFFVTKFLLNTNWASGLNTSVYANPSGCRIFAGVTDQAVATMTDRNEPAGNYIGLRYLWASGGAVGTGQYMQNWAIGSRDNTQAFTGDMGMVFQTGLYRFAVYSPPHPANNIIYYQLDDILRGSGVRGQVTSRLPVGSTAMRAMTAIGFVSGIKAIGTSAVYLETPNSRGIG